MSNNIKSIKQLSKELREKHIKIEKDKSKSK